MGERNDNAKSQRFAAYEMFGKMRSSTDKELEAYQKMIDGMSVPLPMPSIFDEGFGGQASVSIDDIIAGGREMAQDEER